jgi:hypothetical protein
MKKVSITAAANEIFSNQMGQGLTNPCILSYFFNSIMNVTNPYGSNLPSFSEFNNANFPVFCFGSFDTTQNNFDINATWLQDAINNTYGNKISTYGYLNLMPYYGDA